MAFVLGVGAAFVAAALLFLAIVSVGLLPGLVLWSLVVGLVALAGKGVLRWIADPRVIPR